MLARHRYTTRKTWLDFPVGTECWVERAEHAEQEIEALTKELSRAVRRT